MQPHGDVSEQRFVALADAIGILILPQRTADRPGKYNPASIVSLTSPPLTVMTGVRWVFGSKSESNESSLLRLDRLTA